MIIGSHERFNVEVKPDWDDPNRWSITFWRSNHGTGLPYSVTGEDKAISLGQYLYDVFFPEFVAAEKRSKEASRRHMAELAARPKPKPPKIPKNAPTLEVLICPECSRLVLPEDVSDERVYECSRCNQTLSGDDARRCEQCNIFTAKVSDTSCPECSAPMDDAEKGSAQKATNGELVRYFTKEEIAAQEAERAEAQRKREAIETQRKQEREDRIQRVGRLARILNVGKVKRADDKIAIVHEKHRYEIKEVE